jgi:tryptophan synthase alpha chain
MSASLMAHMIAGYPDYDTSLETARALAAGGAAILEIQFPFSDPSADGPAIQAACTEALIAGFKVADGWKLVETVRREFPSIPVFVMSYASIVVTKGVDAFTAQAKASGVTGLIIPDLAPGSDEGLFEAGRRHGVLIVPVIVPSVPPQRLEAIMAHRPEWVYTAIRAGITGIHTTLTPELKDFLSRLNARTKVMAGFGIDSPEQVRDLRTSTHTVVVGSALVRAVAAATKSGGRAAVRRDLEAKVRLLVDAV